VALVALGASLTFESPRGARMLPAEAFFTIPGADPRRENVREPDEILTAISLPATTGRSAYASVTERAGFDWPLVSAAVALQIDGGVVGSARVVLGGVAPVPRRVAAAEQALAGRRLDQATADAAAEAGATGAQPLSDNGYKVQLLRTLLGRMLRSLA
jgi:xanthine dehydrogenase YagS FAD-binding subunit